MTPKRASRDLQESRVYYNLDCKCYSGMIFFRIFCSPKSWGVDMQQKGLFHAPLNQMRQEKQ